jgi:hypothetical protein
MRFGQKLQDIVITTMIEYLHKGCRLIILYVSVITETNVVHDRSP